jgi:dihydroxyacid dehydratase (EC 4.2.1.9)
MMANPPSPLRSQVVTQGVQRSPNRAMLRAVGFRDEDFGKPIVGIANTYSTITPCNIGIQALAERAEAALREAGCMPQVFGTITISDGISMGTEGMKYSLVSREVMPIPSRRWSTARAWMASWPSAAATRICRGR